MKVVKSSDNQQTMMKFDSLDHFALDKLDLEYNKISILVVRAVE